LTLRVRCARLRSVAGAAPAQSFTLLGERRGMCARLGARGLRYAVLVAAKKSSAPKSAESTGEEGVLARGLPPIVPLAQPNLVSVAPRGPGWVHELKLDGYRMLVRVDGDDVQLVTRQLQDWTINAPGVVEAFRALRLRTALFEGEIVLPRENGTTDFHGLRSVRSRGLARAVVFVAFDMLFADGRDLRSLGLLERRLELERLARTAKAGPIQISQLFDSASLYSQACKLGLEGIVSKRAEGAYRAGRATDWQKTKNPHYVRR
jgi:bifunctional non-homologous end joining protein LigD